MPFSKFDDGTRKLLRDVLDGALLVIEVTDKDALSGNRRAITMAKLTAALVEAAGEGHRNFETLQIIALEKLEEADLRSDG